MVRKPPRACETATADGRRATRSSAGRRAGTDSMRICDARQPNCRFPFRPGVFTHSAPEADLDVGTRRQTLGARPCGAHHDTRRMVQAVVRTSKLRRLIPAGINPDLRPASCRRRAFRTTPAERPNGRRAKWRAAKPPEAAPAIEAAQMRQHLCGAV